MIATRTPFEVIHFQDTVLEVFLDQQNLKVIELYHRSGNRTDRFEHSAQSYLQRYVNYPVGKKVLQAFTQVEGDKTSLN